MNLKLYIVERSKFDYGIFSFWKTQEGWSSYHTRKVGDSEDLQIIPPALASLGNLLKKMSLIIDQGNSQVRIEFKLVKLLQWMQEFCKPLPDPLSSIPTSP